jgi:hypothetical protein
MATITILASGNWSSTTVGVPWPGGTLPASTDRVVVPTGMTLTVDGTYAIGDGPDDGVTYVVDCQGTGVLKINNGCRLVAQGNLRFVGGTGSMLDLVGTGTLEIDANPRVTLTAGGAKVYRILGGDTGGWTCRIRGTDANNCGGIVGTPGGYWFHATTGGGTLKGLIDFEYATLDRGWNGQTGISATMWGCARGTAGLAAHVDYLVMTNCAAITLSDSGSGRTADFDRVFHKSGVSNNYYGLNVGGFGASNTVTIRRSAISANQNSQSHTGTDAQECYFYNAGAVTFGPNTRWNAIGMNQSAGGSCPLIESRTSTVLGAVRDVIRFLRGTGTNAKWGGIASSLAGYQLTENGTINCMAITDTEGDGSANLTGAGSLYRFENCIYTASSAGNRNTNFLLLQGAAGQNVEVEHCSFIESGASSFRGIEVGYPAYDGHTGMVAKLRYNAVKEGATAISGGGQVLYGQNDYLVADRLAAATAGDNWIDSATIDTVAETYDLGGTQATPALADHYGALDYIDHARTLADWAGWWGARIGASGDGVNTPNADATYANAHLLLRDTYELGLYAGSDMIQLACMYMRRGWAPTATACRVQGGDGRTHGAFGMWSPVLSSLAASGTGASCTTNAADGTLYWVLTSSPTVPDWDRIIAGQDHTGTSLPAARKGSVTVSTTSPSWSYAPSTGTYYLHIVHSADATTNGDPSQEAYLRTSAETSSGSIAVGGTGKLVTNVVSTLVKNIVNTGY